ncbi:D-alanyl-D-alanine carboxypeptidase [Candidatus Daviesbacteria bacterium]|nr:D-alanyl-D-alanine carboxypeptidase [Candidatus Daviesbacteria bacterium]
MRYYFISAILIVAALAITTFVPFIINIAEEGLVSVQIPQNNSQVAGIQKYNVPPISKNIPAPLLSARAVFVKDLLSGAVLYQKDANISLPIASLTKIMTAIVASEYFKPNSVLTVRIGASVEGVKVGLLPGENLNFRSMLYGMLLSSGNDAAYALAENYPGGILGFVSAMNKKAFQLNLRNTYFDNPAGFDSIKHFSSAKDISIVTEEALKDSTLARIFATKETNIVSLDKKYTHQLSNLNRLLSQVKGVLGVKTGFTQEAKENLVTFVNRDGRQILTVILGSNDRFGESTKLIEWVYQNFTWPDFEVIH